MDENEVDDRIVANDSEELTDEDIVDAVLQPADNATENLEADNIDDGIGKVTAEDR